MFEFIKVICLNSKSKNITVRVVGGLGNQLFIFSFLIYLEKKYNLKIYLDHKSGYQNFFGGNKFEQNFLLNKLKYKFLYQKDKNCFLGLCGKIKRLLIKNFSIFSTIFDTCYIDERVHSDIFDVIKKNKRKNIYISGYFQDMKYISPYKIM